MSRTPTKFFDLEITVVSAKHLKNVNWRNGDLKPFAVFWVDPKTRFSTKTDDSGSSRAVWNEHFVLTIPYLRESHLTLEVIHLKLSESVKPLVGSFRLPLYDLIDLDDYSGSCYVRNVELKRPSGRPQGKIRLKFSLREHPLRPVSPVCYYPPSSPRFLPFHPTHANDSVDYYSPPCINLPPPPPPLPAASPLPYSYAAYTDPYVGSGYYYSGYNIRTPPTPYGPITSGYSAPNIPSAPVEDSAYEQKRKSSVPSAPIEDSAYEQKPESCKPDMHTGSNVGASALGDLSLEERRKFQEE